MKTFAQFLNEEIEDYDYEDTSLQTVLNKIKVEKEKNSLTNIDDFLIVGTFRGIKFYSFKKIKEKSSKLFLCSYDEYRGNSISFREFKNYVEDEDEESDIKMYDVGEDYSYDFNGRVKIDKVKKLIILGFYEDDEDWGEEEG